MDEEKFLQIPAQALNVSCRLRLSRFLDLQDPLCSEDGVPIDYRGLACLMNLEHIDVRNFETTGQPTLSILQEWEKQTDATIGQLLNFLKKMGRHSVIQDILPLIEKDVEVYLKKRSRSQEIPLQVPEVTSCRKNDFQVRNDGNVLTCDDVRTGVSSCQKNDFQVRNDGNALTCDDVRTGEITIYDAYLCYADENEGAALAMAEILEGPELGFKLYIHRRDSLPGQEELISNIQMIKERCRRMLIILSPEFPRSRACDFQIGFATSLAIDQRERILIPIVVAPVDNSEIPLVIRYISKIDFTKPDIQMWAWRRLICSLDVICCQKPDLNSVINLVLAKYAVGATGTCSENFISAHTRPSIQFLQSQSHITNSNATLAKPSIEFPPSETDIAILNNNSSTQLHVNVAVSCQDPSTSTMSNSNVCVSHENKSHINPVYVVKKVDSFSSVHTANEISKPSSFINLRNFFKGKKKSLKSSSHLKGQFSSISVSSTSNATSGFCSHNTFDTESIEGLAKDCSLNTHS
ncbi:myeloid differentiation primary response protein MyD88-like [Uloborus diversus]|uniref:myeloid differentiation primary response protein MyD88-like n=1 Tax=Uloborus diversus TaxID=327109 RepID=UPI002409EDD0|nr:myeloid differentiation primary response protein MyD88-like [Uloborus diversus]